MMSDSSPRIRMRVAGLLTGIAALTATAACGAGNAASGSAADGRTEVTAALYPLEWLAGQVGGPDVSVTALTEPGVEPHDLELTPAQVAGMERTSLVVYIRGVQPAVDEAVGQHAADRNFDAADVVKVLALPAEEEHGEEGHGEEGHGEEGHTHSASDVSYDPHLWLDPSRFASVATALGGRLAVADPAHAAGYRERAAETAAALTALDGELAEGLAKCSSRSLVTGHEAFGYLADRYKLTQVGISVDPDSEPSPARLAEVVEIAKREKVTTIFTETLVSPKVAEVLAQEVGAKTAVLDPIESRPEQGDYMSAMRQNLTTLRAALGCS
ncbi:metal ABC transporter substrate-binding protein [Planomonospora corallina]|uniref:Metal ABC transporter substrate-binding protein n=1 Tax=Planomonospora corallina TaxID=1806052 RepID=A0ABV8ICC2_9ACTN